MHRRRSDSKGILGFVAIVLVGFIGGFFATDAALVTPACERACVPNGGLKRVDYGRGRREHEGPIGLGCVCADGQRLPQSDALNYAPMAGGMAGFAALGAAVLTIARRRRP